MSRCHRNTCFEIKDIFKVHTQFPEAVEGDEESDSEGAQVQFNAAEENVRYVASMMLRLQEFCILPASTVQSIYTDIHNIVLLASKNAASEVAKVLSNRNIDGIVQEELVSAARLNGFEEAFSQLNTDWKRNKYFKSKFKYVKPVAMRYKTEHGLNVAEFQYIPLLESLNVLLSNPLLLNEVVKHRTPTAPGTFATFRDGNIFKNHPIFSAHPHALQIVMYSDEFETVNPLGPHTKKHKILAFYYVLGNLSSALISRKSSIQLLALCKAIDIKRFGLTSVAEVINLDLAALEQEGIKVEGFHQRLYGSLSFICGDNLNSHIIGGFNASFGPNVYRPCRFCLTTNSELQDVIEINLMQLRSKESYDRQCALVTATPSDARTYGIRYTSPFISGAFHVVNGLPPDIMHDLLEGVVPLEMALVLKHLISSNYIDLTTFNRVITTWRYGPLDKQNKPVQISDGGDRIRQNSGRMWCLLRLLPLMIGPSVPQEDEHWKFLLELKQICEMVFAYKLTESHLSYLEIKIQDHLNSFKDLFPSRRLLPKHHFMLHMPECIRLFGPLRMCWCMRFESKHSYFTKLVPVIHNFKNICSTLAKRHQLHQAYLSSDPLVTDDIQLSSAYLVQPATLAQYLMDLLIASGLVGHRPFHLCRFVIMKNISYYKNMYVVVDVDNDLVIFGRINGIYVQDLIPHFHLQIHSSTFDGHLSAYCLQETDTHRILFCRDFFDYYPLSAYRVAGDKLVVLKNFIFNENEYLNN